MIQPSFTSFQEQIQAEQEQYHFYQWERREQNRQYHERVQQMGREILSQPQIQEGPETNGASRNQRRRGLGQGRSRGIQGRGRQGHQSN